jgi:hypothetical protein
MLTDFEYEDSDIDEDALLQQRDCVLTGKRWRRLCLFPL